MTETQFEETSGAEGDPRSNIHLSLREHNIAFVIPYGARMEGKLLLPCGALIYGDYIGDIFCESGSVIIKKGARFRGMVEADIIYVEGDISAIDDKRRSTLIARKMIAGSSNANINADIFSRSFSLHKAKVWGMLRTMEEAEPYRKNNRALERSRIEGAANARTPAKAGSAPRSAVQTPNARSLKA